MLLSAAFYHPNPHENQFQHHLAQSVNKILQSFTKSFKSKGNYLFAQLGSALGLRLQLKIVKSYIYAQGSLSFLNGQPVFIPQIYRNPLTKRLQQTIDIPLRFSYSLETDNLVFKYGFKIDQNNSNPLSMLTSNLRPLISCMPNIYNELVHFGIVKKLNNTYLKSLSKRLKITASVVDVLKKQKNIEQYIKIFRNSQQQEKGRKGSVFKYYKNISQIDKPNSSFTSLSGKQESIKKGGYFQVQKKTCNISRYLEDGKSEQNLVKDLAIKKLRKDQQTNSYYQRKIQKQLKILNQIKNPQHTLTYWVKQPQEKNLYIEIQQATNKIQDKMYMDYAEQTLDDCIYGKSNSIFDIIDYSKQLVQAVQILQKSGIVHRDLKPDNLLIQTKKINGQNYKQIKIIDFAESILTTDNFMNKETNESLGSTLPYSPLQCYMSCQEGFNSSQIDLWSVGLIIYQMLNKKNPLSYSRCFAADIYRGWKIPDQFCIFGSVCKKNSIQVAELILCILTINSVRVQQKQRISIQKMKNILNILSSYLEQCFVMR